MDHEAHVHKSASTVLKAMQYNAQEGEPGDLFLRRQFNLIESEAT